MRHADHFLSRLDRLAGSEVELALRLYREHELLRAILGAVTLPDTASRVAVSLDDPHEGPFLVVTRDGHFVTCLGKGMKATDLPVVTRGQLDGLSAKFGELKARLALATALAGGNEERACQQLLCRLFRSPDSVSREDFLAVSAWEPLLGRDFLDTYLIMSSELVEQAPVLRNLRRSKGQAREALRGYWNLLHAAGHMALLGTMGGDREYVQELVIEQPQVPSAFAFALTSTGVHTFIVKGAWAAGRVGKPLLPVYKKALGEDVALLDLIDSLCALIAIGRRSTGLRAEIVKAFRAAPKVAHGEHAIRLRQALGDKMNTLCEVAVDLLEREEADLEQSLLRTGKALLGLSEESTEEIPSDLLRAASFLSYTDGITDGRRTILSLGLVAAAARGGPEQFYLPREWVKQSHVPWSPELTDLVLEPTRRAEKARRVPAVRKEVPGPNQPCHCGSGRKYKKCCGAPGKPRADA